MTRKFPAVVLAFSLMALLGAGHDNNVEWNGISHVGWLDRTPRCPIDGESFVVSFQAYCDDLTSARIYVDDGSSTWFDATFAYSRGLYDVWAATIPATAPAGSLEYYVEFTDGSDTDYLGPAGVSDDPPATGWILDFATLSHAPLGGTRTSDGGAVFKVWAPSPTTGTVAGEFNGWSTSADPMTRTGDYFTGKIDTPIDDYDQYKFVFNGDHWRPDARGRSLVPDGFGGYNTRIVDPDTYTWNDAAFAIPPFEELVIYELHVGTFSGRGDGLDRMGRYRDIVDTHLDHLLYLGVNAVELMPITEFNYFESWGYNPVNHWSPEEAYGDPDDLKYVIDVLHQHGIAVLLDVVYNHFAPDGNYLWCYDTTQIYFDGNCFSGACDTPWGSQAAFWKFEVQDYFADNILYWLDEYNVDGYRMDATRYMRDPLTCYPAGWSLMREINDRIDRRKLNAISIAEELPNEPATTNPTSSGGAGFDSQWHDLYNDNVRQEIFDAAFGDPEMWRVRDALNDGAYPNKTRLVRYVESHDEAGGDGTGVDDQRLAVSIDSSDPYSIWARGRSKLAQGLTMLAPGIPMFLMGGEWLEDTQFGSGWNNRIDWSKVTSRAPIVLFFRDVISLRKSNCGLRSDAPYSLYHLNESGNVIAFWRGGGQELVIVASFDNDNYTNYDLAFPHGGTWYEILNSQATEYLGNGWGNGGSIVTSPTPPYTASITVPQMGLLVFRHEDAPGRTGDLDTDADTDLHDYSVLQQRTWQHGCGLDADLHENGRVDDVDLAALADAMTGPN